jgi:enoyl-CoA hydratase/carnithine racemase
MSVINGHAFAGGLLFALAHDFRIMTDNPKPKLCLSEINLGLSLPPSYAVLVQATLPPQTARTMSLGAMFTSEQGL